MVFCCQIIYLFIIHFSVKGSCSQNKVTDLIVNLSLLLSILYNVTAMAKQMIIALQHMSDSSYQSSTGLT